MLVSRSNCSIKPPHKDCYNSTDLESRASEGCTCLQRRMYRNIARDVRHIAIARRLISKGVTKALHFRKVLENEGFEVSKKWTLG